jgi:uncharacterized membrane protein YidH (DUF202 family)
MVDDVEGHPLSEGLAQERTELAWSRSGLAVLATVAIIIRHIWPLSGDRSVVVLALIAVGAVIWVTALRLGRRARLGANDNGPLSRSTCRMLTVATLTLALAGAVAAIFLPA